MEILTIEQLYEQQIKLLTADERRKLMGVIADGLAKEGSKPTEHPKRNIMELHGLGKKIWKGIDAQTYVNELREEWDHRP
jgi:hypothetical protein